jgi:cephalosporin hydroxylase
MNVNEFVNLARLEKPAIVDNIMRLQKKNRYDHYWQELLRLSQDQDFFEPCLLQYWIGKNHKPARILEIGTRTGGSLISLLASYSSFKNVQIVSFDLWREAGNTIWLGKIPVIRALIKLFPFNKWLALHALKRNLRMFNIPIANISFISGDSRNTVPSYFRQNPDMKFDYILVDGAHDAETAYIDLENIAPYAASGGFILFDDISPASYNLIGVWNKFKDNHGHEFTFYESFHRKGLAWAVRN